MAVPPREDVRSARRYGRLVDDIAGRYRNPLTGGRLSGAALLLKLASGESGFASDRTSTAGARGRTQFMPGSRKVAIDRFGVDPWRSTDEAYHAAALHLLGKINGSKGLEGYNPGSSSYPSYILNQKVGKVGGGSSSGGGGSPSSPASVLIQAAGGSPQTAEPGADITPMLAALMQRPQGPPVSAPAPVAHAAHAALPAGYQAPSAGGGAVSARPSVDALLDAVRTQGGSIPGVDAPNVSEVRIQGSGGTSGGASPSWAHPQGDYKGAKGPATALANIGFDLGLKSVSEKRHNTNPYSGSRSDHDVGNKDAYAYDLSNGSAPTPEMDRAAFRIARQLGIKDYKMGTPIMRTVQRNGVRVQLIYRGAGPEFGGNHMNHVHVGVKNVRGSGGRNRGVVR